MDENIFFTADEHYGSKRTLEVTRRPFTSVEEMDNAMVARVNDLPENAIVYHVGDFGRYETVKLFRPDIKHVLIFGNYEDWHLKIHKSEQHMGMEFVDYLLDLGFSAIHSLDHQIELYPNVTMNMVHKPTEADLNKFNLFGHIHRLQMVKRFGLNVGVDVHKYRPVPLSTVRHYHHLIESFYDEDVFC